MRFFKSKHQKRVALYKRDSGEEKRTIYDLNEDSIVFDVGGYKGQWASDIYSKYGCNIFIFEPVEKFHQYINNRFLLNDKIKAYRFGLSNKNDDGREIALLNDGSSFNLPGETEIAKVMNVEYFLLEHNIKHIDLMKINIEGDEYDLLDKLITMDFIKNIDNIQVQFHEFIPNAEKRMLEMQKKLSNTHHTTYQYNFVWENWKIN